MKIIKYGIVAVIGAFLLPAPPDDQFMVSNTGQRINLETGEVLVAAASTYSDVLSFCERQSAVCSTAGQVWASLEVKVKYNFQRVYEWSNGTSQDQMRIPVMPRLPQQQISLPVINGPRNVAPADNAPEKLPQQNSTYSPNASVEKAAQKPPHLNVERLAFYTGSVRIQMANATTDNNTNNTLQIEDLIPEWRGPVLTAAG